MSAHRDLSTCWEQMSAAPSLAVDIETTGLDPWDSDITVISVATPAGTVLVDHVWEKGIDPKLIELLRVKPWITHNGSTFDILFLVNNGFDVPKEHYDTLIGEMVLETRNRHDRSKRLGAVMKTRLGRDHKEDIDHRTWTLPELTDEQLSYCENDVLWLHKIKEKQEQLARERKLSVALQKEQALTTLIARITLNGWALSEDRIDDMVAKMKIEAERAVRRIHAVGGPNFNINAPKQVKALLHRWGVPVDKTDKATLNPLAPEYQVVRDILVYRPYRKREGFYGPDWREKWVKNGRVHPRFWQIGAETTRFTCDNPNFQQIPRDMRSMIGNEPGKSVVSADYGQLELRVAAFFAQDKDLINALNSEDIHMEMARAIFRVEHPTSEQRSIAKGVSFAWAFGGSAASLQRTSTAEGRAPLPLSECERIVRALATRYPVMEQFKYRMGRKSSGYITSVILPWGHARHIERNEARPQKLINTRIQGSAAIGIKCAVFQMERRGLLKYCSGLVHDEIVATSIPEAEAPEYARELEEAMRAGMVDMMEDWRNNSKMEYDLVPITVESKVGNCWEK